MPYLSAENSWDVDDISSKYLKTSSLLIASDSYDQPVGIYWDISE